MQLWQLGYAIRSFTRRRYRSPNISTIVNTYNKIILYISGMNLPIGKVYLAFTVVNIPNTCIALKISLFDKIDPVYEFVLLSIVAYMFSCMFGIQYIFALRNSEFEFQGKQLATIPVYHKMSIRHKLKLALLIDTHYTKRKYGMTYWKFGRISMLSFTKVSANFFC